MNKQSCIVHTFSWFILSLGVFLVLLLFWLVLKEAFWSVAAERNRHPGMIKRTSFWVWMQLKTKRFNLAEDKVDRLIWRATEGDWNARNKNTFWRIREQNCDLKMNMLSKVDCEELRTCKVKFENSQFFCCKMFCYPNKQHVTDFIINKVQTVVRMSFSKWCPLTKSPQRCCRGQTTDTPVLYVKQQTFTSSSPIFDILYCHHHHVASST